MSDAIKYLVIIQLSDTKSARVASLVPALLAGLSRISETPAELALRSATADYFAYFIKTKMNVGRIEAALKSPGPKYSAEGMILDGRDLILTIEIGQSFSATDGFSRALTWLQRH